ncbi:MAG TPA: peptidase M24 [Lachnospiraceae bacterium]|nr:peptidase M24 [Lachnospiraceae bacterium]
MTINERIRALRGAMKEAGADVCLVLSQDAHQSEYVAPYWQCRAYMSGFTGSAGTFVCTKDQSAVWVDGRYFLQGEEQTKDSEVQLMKIGEPGVPSYAQWIVDNVPQGGKLFVDGRTISASQMAQLKRFLDRKKIVVEADKDLVGQIWTDRPALPKGPIFDLAVEYTGESRAEKLGRLRYSMSTSEEKEEKADCVADGVLTDDRKIGGGADYYLIASLESTAWLLNLRGSDIEGTPVPYAFTLVGTDSCRLFIDPDKVKEDMKDALEKDGVRVLPYDDLPKTLKSLDGQGAKRIALDPSLVNELLLESIPKDWVKVLVRDLVIEMKGTKNTVERANIYKAHIKDGAVMVRFIKWVKETVKDRPITECQAAEYLDDLRKAQPGSLGISFTTIAGYGPNGAIVHYEPVPESCAVMKPEGFVLVDSGAQYLEGTTDITRTIALGPLTDEMKESYTMVLKGHLQLGHARFPEHISGTNLDILARKPLWDKALDYKHGTGHGVGYLLGVHEGPMNISYRQSNVTLVPGMLISDEPGYYPTGKYGVRIENLMMVERWCQNEWGTFDQMNFVTLCPYERQAIVKEMLTDQEIRWVDQYHQRIYEELSPLLDEDTAAWLKEETRPL